MSGREDSGQVALPISRRRPGWPGARLLVVASARPGCSPGVLPSYDQFDRCTLEYVVTDKATFYPSAIRTCPPGAKHTATGFYNLVISTNRCERNHGYVKSRICPMRGLKSFACATRLFPVLDALQLVERDFVRVPSIGAPCTFGRSYVRPRHIAAVITRLGQNL
jgi:hypothetical protein